MTRPLPTSTAFTGIPASRQRRITSSDLGEELEAQPGPLDPTQSNSLNLPDPHGDAALHTSTDDEGHVGDGHENVEDELAGLAPGTEERSLSAADTQFVIRQRWERSYWDWRGGVPSDSESDSESIDNSGSEHLLDGDGDDDEGDGPIDWDAVVQGLELSAWDRLGERYDMEAAISGTLFWSSTS